MLFAFLWTAVLFLSCKDNVNGSVKYRLQLWLKSKGVFVSHIMFVDLLCELNWLCGK